MGYSASLSRSGLQLLSCGWLAFAARSACRDLRFALDEDAVTSAEAVLQRTKVAIFIVAFQAEHSSPASSTGFRRGCAISSPRSS